MGVDFRRFGKKQADPTAATKTKSARGGTPAKLAERRGFSRIRRANAKRQKAAAFLRRGVCG